MITLYVDKLHSVEVLIIGELECSLPMPMPSPSSTVITTSSATSQQTSQLQTTAIATQAFPPSTTTSQNKMAVNQALEPIFPPCNGFDLLGQIESMSAEAPQEKRVLEVVKAEGSSETSSSATSEAESSSNQHHQYSAAANLN